MARASAVVRSKLLKVAEPVRALLNVGKDVDKDGKLKRMYEGLGYKRFIKQACSMQCEMYMIHSEIYPTPSISFILPSTSRGTRSTSEESVNGKRSTR